MYNTISVKMKMESSSFSNIFIKT